MTVQFKKMLIFANKKQKTMQSSIFRLDEIRCNEAESQNYLDAITSIRGHFSSLEKAVSAMKRNASETYLPEEIYAY